MATEEQNIQGPRVATREGDSETAVGGPGGRTRQELRTTMPGPTSRPRLPSTGTGAGKCTVPTLWTGHGQTTPGCGRCGLGGRRQAGGIWRKTLSHSPSSPWGSHCGVWDTAAPLLSATAMSPLWAALGAGSPSPWKGLWGVLPCGRTTWVAGRPDLSLPVRGLHPRERHLLLRCGDTGPGSLQPGVTLQHRLGITASGNRVTHAVKGW